MLVILWIAFTLLRARAVPLSPGPITDPTIAHTIFFGIQPRADGSEVAMRTMYDIIRSCFFTIAACVYRAIHQNIPDPTASFWGRLRIRVKITLCALIAPELMIWWALRQRFGAMSIKKEVNRLKLGIVWTQTHGQFAQMGGFARKDNKQVLFPSKLIELLRDGFIDPEDLQFTKEDIDDKSKGDILSKGLVAFQTTWFVFECLARLAQNLPVIELEVVTLAFATLNIITYALWWHKPLNVLRPIYIHVRDTPRPPAPQETVVVSVGTKDEAEPLLSRPRSAAASTVADNEQSVGDKAGRVEKMIAAVGRKLEAIGQCITSMASAVRTDVKGRPWWRTVWLWLIKQPFIVVITPLWDLLGDYVDYDSSARPTTHVSTFYGMRISNAEISSALRFSCIVGMAFGAIHFLSWHASFPTHTELLLWRISAVVLVAEPCVMLLGDLLDIVDTSFFLFTGGILGPICYILARLCILVLAFLALKGLPPRAFDNISWTSYIPHL